jgi:hypothetical protein
MRGNNEEDRVATGIYLSRGLQCRWQCSCPGQHNTAQHSTCRFKGWWRAPLRGAGCCTATLSASASPAGEVSGRWLERQLLQGFNTGQWGARLAVGNLTAGRSVCFKFRLSTEGIGAGGVKSIDREMRKERCHEAETCWLSRK